MGVKKKLENLGVKRKCSGVGCQKIIEVAGCQKKFGLVGCQKKVGVKGLSKKVGSTMGKLVGASSLVFFDTRFHVTLALLKSLKYSPKPIPKLNHVLLQNHSPNRV